jgi:hypothetical protein
MSVHDWLIQARVAFDEVKAATSRAFQVEEHSANTSELSQLEDRILLSATPVAVVAAPEADATQQDAESPTAETESTLEVASAGQTDALAEEPRTINDSLALLDRISNELDATLDFEAETTSSPIVGDALPLESFAAVTGSDIAASTDTTGADSLLQFGTTDGHVLGFGQTSLIVASPSHMLNVELVGANLVGPTAADAAADAGSTAGAAQPFTSVSYVGLWDGVTAVYDAQAEPVHHLNPIQTISRLVR